MQVSRPGVTYAVPLASMSQTYDRHGFPGEWREHSQGGLIGYAGREFVPGPAEHPDVNTRRTIELHTAIAYNPTVQGAKTEDTPLVAEGGPEVVTVTADWPSVTVPVEGGHAERPAIAVGGR